MRLNLQPKSLRSVQQQTLGDDHLLIKQISQLNPNLPKPKLLKSCIRCRKHKTKCDAQNRAPLPCSSCSKKGCACKIDYVLPPQRSDNLKNLISQVDFIKDQYDTLSSYYVAIGEKLGVEIESFDDWKTRNWLSSASISTSDDDNNGSITENQSSEYLNTCTEHENDNTLINLIKLSDGSFISMDINTDTNQLIINNNVISIEEFEKLASELLIKLHHIGSIFLNSTETNDIETDDSTSSRSSPVSFPSPKSIPLNHIKSKNWVDLNFETESLFKNNKFLLIMIVSFYYPQFQLNFQLFLKDYLISYYSIIETLNTSSNTSTYSANILMNTLMNKQSNIASSTLDSSTNIITFNKFQLRCLISSEIFNSESFLKKLIQLLFLNIIINGIDSNLEIFNQFVKFIELNINNNRRKLNFDKNEHLKFIEKIVQLFNLFQSLDIDTFHNSEIISNHIPKKSSKSTTSSSLTSLNHTLPQLDEKSFLRFEQLILKDFEFFQTAIFNENLSINNDPDFNEVEETIEKETEANIKLQQISLFKTSFNSNSMDSTSQSSNSMISTINPSSSSSSSSSSSATAAIATLNGKIQFNGHDLKFKYSRFLDNWANFFALFETKKNETGSYSFEKLFIEDFLLELKVLNVSILIIEGFKEFQPLLYQIPEHYSIGESLHGFISLFSNIHNINISDNEIEPLNFNIGSLEDFSCDKSKVLYSTLMNLVCKNRVFRESSSRMNDIQVILENVDWKRESTEDVLRKIGVI